jgi:hypothetical protein
MTAREMQISFEIESNLQDPTKKPTTIEIFYWINKAVEKFIKTRYSGLNYKGQGFEQTQKRIDDLRTLVKDLTIVRYTSGSKPNSSIFTLPNDYLFTVGEEVLISFIKNGSTITSREGITEITNDRYRQEVDNHFSEFRLYSNWARPLRLFSGTYVELISDGQYDINQYYLTYISKPTAIALPSTNCNLPEQTHSEIVKLAVGMFLENIKDPRYQTYSNEINTME